jgi:hypothetical protein
MVRREAARRTTALLVLVVNLRKTDDKNYKEMKE